jgi:hypothetical protein
VKWERYRLLRKLEFSQMRSIPETLNGTVVLISRKYRGYAKGTPESF